MQEADNLRTLDKVPGYNLYIGGFIALRRPKALTNCHITHIVSVLDWKFDDQSPLIKEYKHLHISVDDVDDENLLTHFPLSNAFIKEGLNYRNLDECNGADINDESTRKDGQGSGVLIHCAMGKSRSATVLIAYLLHATHRAHANHPKPDPKSETASIPSKPLTVDEALALVRRGRPLAEPNDGFMEQLNLYHAMGCPDDVDSHPLYQRWLYRQNLQVSLSVNQAPELDVVRFEDEHDDDVADDIPAPTASSGQKGKSQTDLKCRKCRRLLAKSNFALEHSPPEGKDRTQCAHIFLHPLSWMKPALSTGQLDGRLTCPNERCGANVGKFAWQGMRCSCGGWETPAFGIARARVDEVPGGSVGTGVGWEQERGGAGGIRLPPGTRRPGNGNL